MEQPRQTDIARPQRKMFIRDLVMNASIGVYPHEHGVKQRVRINLDVAVAEESGGNLSRPAVGRDDVSRVVDYEQIVNRVREIVGAGHVQLIETLAERIAETCLVDPRVTFATVRVEKLDVFADAASAGVEIERRNC